LRKTRRPYLRNIRTEYMTVDNHNAPEHTQTAVRAFWPRFWRYQAERFPLASYIVLVAALVLGGLGYAAGARGEAALAWDGFFVAWTTILGLFFQMRVADEFKDFAQDARYRPYRPVPRGLISLRELARVALAVGVVQLALNAWLDMRLLLSLAAAWGYLWLMRQEFFVPDWLTARPLLYMLSHMGIMLFLFFYIAAVDWLPAGASLSPGLAWLLLGGYANGVVFEIGRKVRAPGDEEPGVETYSSLWGAKRAAWAWWLAVAIAGLALSAAAGYADAGWPVAAVAVPGVLLAGWVAARYARQPETVHARWVDRYAALWVLAIYTCLGVGTWWL
jgi:hypothetical protein